MKRMNKNTEDFIKILKELKPGSIRDLEIEINNISKIIVEIEGLRKEQINKYQLALQHILKDLNENSEITTGEVFLIEELVEKTIKKDVKKGYGRYGLPQAFGTCSNCDKTVLDRTNGNYCGNCGHKVRW